ncbi:MAG: N-acetyltransferase [Oscillospiraceae bacterium]|nr:N-acetyltransferase [Oscillospiraceae bacterium]
MIRPATEQDVPEILSIYAPYVENSTATFEYDVPCRRSFTQRFRDITAQYPWLVWEEEGKILGYAYASAPYSRAAFSWCAEPSIYLRPEAKGRRIGRKLYAVLEEILRLQGYQVLYALITAENVESIRFHQQAGYEKKADFPNCGYKFQRWLGLIWMEKRIKIVQSPSGFPLPWKSIVQDAERFSNILDNLSLS